MNDFKPEHVNADHEDFLGNNGIGRYILLPGSDGRAKKISERFSNVEVKEHSRRHNLYKGTYEYKGKEIDIAVIATGMGTPSLDIIVTELIRLGATRFLRVGTCGPLQDYMKIGDFTVATGAVKDDGATNFYMPSEIPAQASLDMILASEKAAEKLAFNDRTYYGTVHSKGSLYGREFSHDAPLREENVKYMRVLTDSGVVSSEMEASMLFTLAAIKNAEKPVKSFRSLDLVKAGAICVAVTEGDVFVDKKTSEIITNELVDLSFATIGELAEKEFSILK